LRVAPRFSLAAGERPSGSEPGSPRFKTEDEFWAALEADHLVRLADENGKGISQAQLPKSLDVTPDDPYRSLAWLVRKQDGFCRSTMPQKEFAEFTWADFLRTQPSITAAAVKASAAAVLPEALKLVRSPAAKDVPGYVGDQPAGFKCPPDP